MTAESAIDTTPSRDTPIQSPSCTSPASVVVSRTARVISAGTTVDVMQIEGATALVYPRE